jgi:hypothetical protein
MGFVWFYNSFSLIDVGQVDAPNLVNVWVDGRQLGDLMWGNDQRCGPQFAHIYITYYNIEYMIHIYIFIYTANTWVLPRTATTTGNPSSSSSSSSSNPY